MFRSPGWQSFASVHARVTIKNDAAGWCFVRFMFSCYDHPVNHIGVSLFCRILRKHIWLFKPVSSASASTFNGCACVCVCAPMSRRTHISPCQHCFVPVVNSADAHICLLPQHKFCFSDLIPPLLPSFVFLQLLFNHLDSDWASWLRRCAEL